MDPKLNIYGIRPVMELIESGKEIDTIYLQNDIKTEWAINVKKNSILYKNLYSKQLSA